MADDDKKGKFKKELDELKSDLKLQDEMLSEAEEKLALKDKELAENQEAINKKDEELQEYLSHIQRLQADYENLKRQSEKNRQDIIAFANENLIMNILDSYEDLERALNQSKNEKELREGLELIYSKLKSTLEKEGLQEIEAKGEKFDPFKHEALMVDNSPDCEDGIIVEELMKGYTLKDKVIKYSKVKVCRNKKKEDE